MSLIGPSGNTGVFIAPNEALYLYARTGNLILQSSNVFLSGLPIGNVVTVGTGGRLLTSGTTATELGFLSGVTSSVQGQMDSKFNASGHSTSRVLVTSGTGAATTSAITTTELGYLSGLSNNIQQQLNNVQSTLVLNPNIVPVTSVTGNVISSTITNVELGYLAGLRSGIQSQIDTKQNTIVFPSGINRVLVTDGTGNVATSSITTTDLSQLSGVTSGIQNQLNSKLNASGYTNDRIVVTSGSGSVTTSSVATANLIAMDSLRSIASNVVGNLIVSGNVGILKNNPNVALDVAGGIVASSLGVGILNATAAVNGTLSADSITASTVTVSSQLRPSTHNTVDIGTNSTRFRDLYVQGTIYAPSIVSTTSAASNVIVTDNTLLATPQYLLHVPGTSGEQPSRVTSSRLSFVPQTGNLSATNFIGNLTGIAANATRWTNARTIQLTGPVTGTVTLDGTQNVSFATTVSNDAVALGTHTTGNYVATIGAGAGGITVSGSGSENAAVTIGTNATDQNTGSTIVSRDAVGNFSAGTIAANLSGIAANATRWTNARTIQLTGPVTGTVTLDGTQNVSFATTVANDAVALGTHTTGNYVATIGAGAGSGLTVSGSGSENAAVTISTNATSASTGGAIVSRDAQGNFSANTIAANITGIAANATRWTNARTIQLTGPVTGTVTLDGTSDATIATTLSASAVTLGTNTSGSYVSAISGSNGLSTTFTGSSVVVSSNAASMNVGGAIVSRDAQGNFSANTIAANLNGIATSATRLQTTRFINGQPFDGTGDVTIPSTVMATLTPGTYISGSAYDGTVARTWTLNASTSTSGSTIVARDANGDFSARTITANLTGEATVAARVRNLLRPGTGFAFGTSNYDGQADVTWNIGTLGTDNFPTLAGLTAATYGGTTTTVNVTVDNKGRITAISGQAIPSASTTQVGLVQLNDAINSTLTTQAGTANAVKTAYDRGTQGINDAASANANANNRVAKTGDAMTGTLSAPTFIGNLTGIAANATRWTNARTIQLTGPVTGTVTLDGTQNVSIATTLSASAVTLGTNTSGSYVSAISGSNGLSTAFTGSSVVVSSNAASTNVGGAIVSRDAAGNFSAGTIAANFSGIAANATRWTNARTIQLTGPVTGTVTLDGTQNVSFATTVANDAVALGTHTTGNYVATIGAGSGGITVSGSGSENAAVTIGTNATDQNTGSTIVLRDTLGNFSANTIAANITGIAANATRWTNARTIQLTGPVTGTVTLDGTQNVSIATTLSASAVTLGTNTSGSYVSAISGSNGLSTAFTGSSVVVSSNAASTNVGGAIVSRDAAGNFSAGTITANLTGHASSAARLWPGATINGVNFDGTTPITFSTAVPSSLIPGSFISGSSFNGGVERTWNINAGSTNVGSTIVARDGVGNFVANTITANLVGEASVAVRVKFPLRPGTGFASGTSNYDGQADVTWNIGTLGTDNFPTLAGLTAATYGGTTTTVNVTVDNKGRITAISGQAIPSASTTQAGLVQLNDAINSTSTTQAGTANAVKTAYDRGSQGINDAASANANANNRVAKTGDTMSGTLTINNGSPTIIFQDTDHNSAFLYCDSNLLYVLRGGINATIGSQVNSQWPWIWNLTNNDSTCGGSLTCVGTSTATRFISSVATGTAPLAVSSTTLVSNLNADLLDNQHGSHYLDCANFTGTLSADRLATSGVVAASYGGSTTSASITVDNKGRITGASSVTIQPSWDNVQGKPSTFTPPNTINRVRTDGSDGTHGSITISGSKNSYAGIHFSESARIFMVTDTTQGIYTGAAWQWFFQNGVLTVGTVPWARLSDVPSFIYNDSGTYSINITGNAGTAGGLFVHSARNNEANKIVRTDVNGYLNAGWFSTTSGDNGNTTPTRFYASSDEFIRFHTRGTYKMHLGLTGRYNVGRVEQSTNSTYWTGIMGWQTNTLDNMVDWGCGFIDTWGTAGSENRPSDGASHHVGLQAFHNSSGAVGYGWQMVMGGGTARWWLRNHWGGVGVWYEVVLNDNRLYGISISGNAATATSAGSCTGNSATATTLQTGRNINGVSFNGSDNITINGLAYNVNDGWLRRLGDANYVQLYGNSRTMVFRTDGTTQYSDNGAYPFVWLFGGDNSGNRRMILDGNLWTSNYGWLHEKFADRGITITAGDGLSGSGSLAANMTLTVNSTVIRTTGDQTLGGTKTFSSMPAFSSSTGSLTFANSGTTTRGILGMCGDTDYWFFGGGATASNAGFLEIATGDDSGTEPIYVRQYSGIPSGGTVTRTLTLLDASGNTSIPGTLTGGTVPWARLSDVPSYAATNQTFFLGTTSIAINRGSNAQTLTGVSIDGSSGSCTGNSATATTSSFLSTNSSNANVRLASGAYETSAATTANGWPVTTNAWYHLLACTHSNTSNNYSMQLAADFYSNTLYYRSTNGSGATGWSQVVLNNGASWGISITGNANYANSSGSTSYVTWSNVDGKPSTFTPSSHTHAASDITSGTLGVARGGTGQATLEANKVLVGNGTSGILQPTNLHWDNTNFRLGIGATSPSYPLHVLRSVNGDQSIVCTNSSTGTAARATMTLLNDFNGYLEASVYSTTSTTTFAGVSMTGSGASLRTKNQFVLTTETANPLYFGTSNTVRMTILGAGNVGIGISNPSYLLHVSGGDIACSADVIAFASDERLKTNVRTIENPLDKINQLSGVHFDWIPEVRALGFCPPRMTDEVGLLAQQVQSVVPQAVAYAPFDREGDKSKSGQDYLTIKYDKLVPLLLEGIKELRKEVEDLKKIIRDHGI